MFHAHMESEHYSWEAFGRHEHEARDILFEAFCKHLLSTGLDGYTDLDDYFECVLGGPLNPETLDEWYGITVTRVGAGLAFRDRELVLDKNPEWREKSLQLFGHTGAAVSNEIDIQGVPA